MSKTLDPGPHLCKCIHYFGLWIGSATENRGSCAISLVVKRSTSGVLHNWLIAWSVVGLSCQSVLTVKYRERLSALTFSNPGRYWAERDLCSFKGTTPTHSELCLSVFEILSPNVVQIGHYHYIV